MTSNRKVHWMVRGLGVLAASASVSYSAVSGATPSVGSSSGADAPCAYMCWMSGVCPAGEHRTYPHSDGTKDNAADKPDNGSTQHTECYALLCEDWHHCSPEPELVEQTATAISDANGAELRRLLSGNTAIAFNRDRSAVQIRGCGGEVVANLPASGRLIDEVLGSR